MAKRKFDKLQSLEEGEVILEPIDEAEVLAWSDVEETIEQEVADEVAIEVPTISDIKWAKANLAGTPITYDSECIAVLQRLTRFGIAADFGADGYARGFKWHTV